MNGPYNPPPEATLQPGVTAGKLMDVAVTAKVFPGANRTVQVYIPAGYVERTPAPFMVLQDGPSYVTRFKLPTVLDNMIAKKQLPPMLAIFVPNAGGRRSVEYDTLSDAYVRFVLEDVLPAVEAGAPVKLTTDPEGRSAGGHSSGGIAAFTMGWERPDQFRRILTHSGSFVSIRGGDKYPGIVTGHAGQTAARVHVGRDEGQRTAALAARQREPGRRLQGEGLPPPPGHPERRHPRPDATRRRSCPSRCCGCGAGTRSPGSSVSAQCLRGRANR